MGARNVVRVAARALPRPVRARAAGAIRATTARARAARRPRWGNLRRIRPFSDRYGFDRGTPVDRVLLDRFFAAHAGDITGAVLEVKDAMFTDRFGAGVTSIDLVDIAATNTDATLIADLAEPGSLPAAGFDCVIVPQTLQYVDDAGAAIANAWQALRPGGVLLVTAPSAAPADPQLAAIDRWRFTPAGLDTLLQRWCPGAEISVAGYGNLVVMLAFLHGLAAEELDRRELDANDPRYPLVACGRARRPA